MAIHARTTTVTPMGPALTRTMAPVIAQMLSTGIAAAKLHGAGSSTIVCATLTPTALPTAGRRGAVLAFHFALLMRTVRATLDVLRHAALVVTCVLSLA